MSPISAAVDRPAVVEPGTISLSEWDEEYSQRDGIPGYRFAERLMLFSDPRGGAYHALTSADGATPLTLRLGQHTIKITLADLT